MQYVTSTVKFTGIAGGDDVNQTPMLWKIKGEDAEMTCNHTKGATYYQMYWYRQKPGETMKQIVFTQERKSDYEPGFSETKYPATKPDAQRGTLIVKSLVPADNGLYFCAVSEHSDADARGR